MRSEYNRMSCDARIHNYSTLLNDRPALEKYTHRRSLNLNLHQVTITVFYIGRHRYRTLLNAGTCPILMRTEMGPKFGPCPIPMRT